MSGPGPHQPPFFQNVEDVGQKALAAIEAAITRPFAIVDVPPVPAAIVATISAALDKAHAAERAALDKAHAVEKTAADALDHIWTHVESLVRRFPNAGTAKGQLEAAFRGFAAAIGG